MGSKQIRRMCVGLLAIATFIAIENSGRAAKVAWRSNFKRAAQESARVKKPMLLEITADWCGYCHKMLQQTFTNEQVVRHVNGCFIPVSVDADDQKQLVAAIGIEGLPTTVIISPEMKVLKKLTGYHSAAELEKHLGKICRLPRKQVSKRQPARAAVDPKPAPPFQRLCLVSLRDQQKLRSGSTEYSTTYKGAKLVFASAEHQRRFEANPGKYWPAWDGYCAVSGIEEKTKRSGDPQWGAVYRGQMWFFADKTHQQKFLDAPTRFLPKQKP